MKKRLVKNIVSGIFGGVATTAIIAPFVICNVNNQTNEVINQNASTDKLVTTNVENYTSIQLIQEVQGIQSADKGGQIDFGLKIIATGLTNGTE